MTIENSEKTPDTTKTKSQKDESLENAEPSVEVKEATEDSLSPEETDLVVEELGGESATKEDLRSEPSMSEAEIAQLLIDLSEAQEKAAKVSEEKKLIYEQLMRRQAEFENFRKRVERERSETHAQARSNVVIELLPVLDNLERALDSAPKGEQVEAIQESILTGVRLVHRQFLDVLTGLGLSQVKALGEAFDPHLHEAVTTEANNDLPENTIVAELQKGYKLGEKLLRPAMVKVAVRG
jgi:molecular chaperone GrpE